jgi:hypothetical protein
MNAVLPIDRINGPGRAARTTGTLPRLEELEQRLVPTGPRPTHVVVVIEENHPFGAIIGSNAAPYINTLAGQGAVFTNSFAITHPSEPNYLALFSGSTQGITDDSCPHTFNGPDLGGELLTAGFSFTGFSEDLPASGYAGCNSANYARKHNPWVDFTDVPAASNQPFSAFPTDFTQLPTVAFVVPNLVDDMHDGTIGQGDSWLQAHIDPYVQWAKSHNSLLIVTWDEDDGSQNDHIPTLFVGPMVQAGQYGESINHYNVLRTIEDMYALPYAGSTAQAASITDVWTQPPPALPPLLATGADAGGGPEVVFTSPAGTRFDFFAYTPSFLGGVRVAVGDVNGDGVPDLITAPGPGGAPEIKVFDGNTGVLIRDFMAYDAHFLGGVYVAAGDVNGDGFADIVVGADAGGGPHVQAFSGKDGSVLQSFYAYNPAFRGGVRVAAGDVNGDGFADIITAAGPGGGPHVQVFSGKDGSVLRSFFAYNPAFTGGVYLAAGDINGDGSADIITGPGAGGAPTVEAFSGATGALLQSFQAYDPHFAGGVRVGVLGNVSGDGRPGIITGAGPGGGPAVLVFDAATLALLDGFFAYNPAFRGGVYVGGQ